MDSMDYVIELNYPKNTLIEEEKEKEEIRKKKGWKWDDVMNFLYYARGKDE
jgi:hypothetical protein